METEEEKTAKYTLLIDFIKRQIADGVYRQGDKLSSENKLAQQFGFSRQTIRQGLGVLEQEGVLVRRRGSGTYVNRLAAKAEKTMNIGVITTYITDYIFPGITRGIEETLSQHGYHLTLGVTKNRVENESKILYSFLEGKVDGLIVEGTQTAFPNPNLSLYRRLTQKGIPYIFINGFYKELNAPYVVTNDRKCGLQAAEYLLRTGRNQKIGGIFKSDDMQGHERYAGFAAGVLKHGGILSDDAVLWYTTADVGTLFSDAGVPRLLKCFADCAGVVCYNDQIAYALIQRLQKSGVRVPEQISVIGVDNANVSQYSPIPITTFDHPKEQLGREAAERIIRMVAYGTKEQPLVIDMPMIVRESTGPAR